MQEGVGPKAMNTTTKKMGFPVGLATLFDEVGVDVGAHIGEYLGGVYGDRFGNPEAMVAILKEFVANGLLGRKGGQGVFLYEAGQKDRPENPKALELLQKYHVPAKVEWVAHKGVGRTRSLGHLALHLTLLHYLFNVLILQSVAIWGFFWMRGRSNGMDKLIVAQWRPMTALIWFNIGLNNGRFLPHCIE